MQIIRDRVPKIKSTTTTTNRQMTTAGRQTNVMQLGLIDVRSDDKKNPFLALWLSQRPRNQKCLKDNQLPLCLKPWMKKISLSLMETFYTP